MKIFVIIRQYFTTIWQKYVIDFIGNMNKHTDLFLRCKGNAERKMAVPKVC